ncbi:MAG: hypothetical protein IT297_03890 [Anaerolineae bacterium]|nr:hypothetical protein [Anaerolineae bacterium]MCZ7553328.1 hypothetical protein [Anaerolineales bacterium]
MKDLQNTTRSGEPRPATPRPAGLPVRSGLRMGAASGCELGIQYWRRELNYWRDYARRIGCE